MKLLRYGAPGAEKPGILDADGKIRDLSGIVGDIDGAALSPEGLTKIKAADVSSLPVVGGDPRLGDTVVPRASKKLDYEVELGIVIGKKAKYVSEADALDYVAGYCVVNDVSEREFQAERSGQWTKGKSCDTFGPTGPWMVTKDEIPDPQALGIWAKVNGETRQDGNTNTMVYGPAFLVHYLSQFFTLEPGDVIPTGTPPGVGMGFKPEPKYLKAGDVVELGIDGLGVQRQTCVADS